MRKRDESIDALRWLALTGIILVHSEPSAFWAQLRSFDVPLMVILSAVVFTYGGGESQIGKTTIEKDLCG